MPRFYGISVTLTSSLRASLLKQLQSASVQQASTTVGLERELVADKEHAMMFVQGRLKGSEFTLESEAEPTEELLVEQLTKLRAASKSGSGGRVITGHFYNMPKKRDEQTKIPVAERQQLLLTNGSILLRLCG
jgi:hypothetical protein